jgi:hypothetical protein
MKEATVRKWHRRMGITLALFIILQAGTGLVLSLEWFDTSNTNVHKADQPSSNKTNHFNNNQEGATWHEAMELVHHGAGTMMKMYRVILGLGLVGMALSGSVIFQKIKTRNK